MAREDLGPETGFLEGGEGGGLEFDGLAVGEEGGGALDEGYFVGGMGEEPGEGGAGDAGAADEDVHRGVWVVELRVGLVLVMEKGVLVFRKLSWSFRYGKSEVRAEVSQNWMRKEVFGVHGRGRI